MRIDLRMIYFKKKKRSHFFLIKNNKKLEMMYWLIFRLTPDTGLEPGLGLGQFFKTRNQTMT